MPWTHQGKIIREGRGWVDADGVKHPTSWASWSDEEKTAKGLVWQEPPASYDSRFWWDADTPKALDDVTVDGVTTLGLKSIHKGLVKQQAGSLLAATDWYVVRHAETGQAVPPAVLTHRSAIRAYSDYLEGEIDAAADHAAFVALFEGSENVVAPMFDWPEA